MTRKTLVRNLLLATLAVSTLVWTFSYALAQPVTQLEVATVPCPDNKPCKVLVLTEEQAQTLDQLVTNTAIQGPYAQIHALVQFYKEMLANAPAGKPKAEVKK